MFLDIISGSKDLCQVAKEVKCLLKEYESIPRDRTVESEFWNIVKEIDKRKIKKQ